MLHLALAALLAGSLGTGDIAAPADGDKDKAPRTEAAVGLNAADDDDALLVYTYGYGQSEPTFIDLWAGFSWGRASEVYDASGNEQDIDERTIQRFILGAQLNLLRLDGLTFGVGGQFVMGSMDVENVGDTGFGTHSVALFGQLQGRVLGLHAGYIIDLSDDPDPDTGLFSGPHPDQLDAFLIGFTFDYQPAWLRLFGGVDMFRFIDHPGHDGTGWDSPSLVVFNLGGGVEFGWVELGLAGLWRTNVVHSAVGLVGSSHNRMIAPYVSLSPPFLPVGLSVRGASFRDYADTAFSLGGALDVKSDIGFTAMLTWGF